MIACHWVSTPEEIEIVRSLFREYTEAVNAPACFQSFEKELANLPGDYGPPRGRLLLARDADKFAGCAALRPLSAEIGEIKRLYVRDAFRGLGVGKLLVETLVLEARAMGYRAIRLDTLPSMAAAICLYRSLGFHEIPAYTFNPIDGALFLEKAL